MAATLRDNCSTQTLFFNFPHGTTEQNGQTITPTESYVLETIKFYAKWKYGNPGTCYISLQETTAGLPNGSLLTDRVSFTITADKALKSITFSTQPILQIGTKYAIVFEAPNGVASSGELHLYGNASSGNDYTGGDRVWYNGSDWATVTSQDLNFYCWGLPGLPGKPINPTPTDTDTEVDFSDFTLSWTTGGDTDTYNVWIGDSDNLYLCYEGHTETSYVSNYDELITNGNFSDWSFGEPDDWTISGDFFTDVLQCGDNEGHHEAIQSDSGLGLCNIYNSHLFGDTVDVYQYVTLEVGKRYKLSIEVNKAVTGELTIWAGANGVDLDETVDSVATHSWTFQATSETELIAIKSLAETDVTIDNVSVILNEIPYDEVVYWEIDAVNEYGTTEGDVWTFDPRPGQVSTFTPLDEATGLTLSEVGSTWESPSGNTDSYSVYFGIESGDLALVDNTIDLLLDLVGVFPTYNYTYYWAIDAVNDFGVTAGNEVSFTTIAFYPPLPTGVTLDEDGSPTGTPTGENNMISLRKLVAVAYNKIWFESI